MTKSGYLEENMELLERLGLVAEASSGALMVRDRKLTGLDFGRLWILGGDFSHTTLDRCAFPAHAPGIKLSEGSSKDCDFAKCNMGRAQINNFTFSGCNLTRADFYQAIFTNVRLVDCNLLKTNFDQAKLTGVSFERCTFDRTSFIETSFSDVEILDPVIESRVFTDAATVDNKKTLIDAIHALQGPDS